MLPNLGLIFVFGSTVSDMSDELAILKAAITAADMAAIGGYMS